MLENRYTVLRFRLEDIDGRTGISQLQRKLKKTDSGRHCLCTNSAGYWKFLLFVLFAYFCVLLNFE